MDMNDESSVSCNIFTKYGQLTAKKIADNVECLKGTESRQSQNSVQI